VHSFAFPRSNNIFRKEKRMATTQTQAGQTQAEKNRLATGLFTDRESAEKAYNDLSSRGYRSDDINVVMSDDTRAKYFDNTSGRQTELGNKAAKGAGVGGAVGGTAVGIAAAIAAAGASIAIPGLGLVIAGPLAAGLAGAGAGAAAGGLVGAMVGWGIPEERVKDYEAGIKKGGILMGVKPRSEEDAQYLESQWKGYGSDRARH
jgi:hypothetical protein